jgi:hypothetical protein
VVAAQPVVPESTPVPVPGKSDLMMVVIGAAVIRITVIIGISVFQIKRPHSREIVLDFYSFSSFFKWICGYG